MVKDTGVKEVKVINKGETTEKSQSTSTDQNSSFSIFRQNVMEKIPVVLRPQR